MKKICFITTVHGTLRSFVLVTAEYLHNSGEYDITFICNGNNEFAESLPEYIKYIPVPMSRGINLNIFRAIIQFMRIFKREEYDIVQYATPNAALYGSIAAKLSGINIRLYGQWGLRYVTMSGVKRHVFKAIEKLTCSLSTHVHVTSFKNREYAVKEGLYNTEKATVLGEGGATGIEIKDYDIENKKEYSKLIRDKYGLDDSFVFGFVGRFSRDKGANELLIAVRNISKSEDIRFLCIGDIELSSEIDSELYEWAKNSNAVIFAGRIDNSDLPKYYASMDCYVHPSYREGYSKVIQEAAAMGCAIITTDIPGASEVMERDISCLLVPPGDSELLESKMRELIYDDKLRHTLEVNSRYRVERYFDRKKKLKIQKEFYDSLTRPQS